ncbi:MAG: protein translocase subunit SecD [bacterium]|nr:protein translocase subunit SecD [bacterium]
MLQRRVIAVCILLVGALLGYFVYWSQLNQWKPFKLGLDLSGGTHLVYDADTSKISNDQIGESLSALQSVIERRINAFGVGEPLVQTEQAGALGRGSYRLIVELPGVTDVNEAIKLIGQTPLLEFKLVKPGMESEIYNEAGVLNIEAFQDTGLTGKYLKSAQLQFGNGSSLSSEAVVVINFNSEGGKLFGDITTANVNHELAIFLDGNLLSAPVINEPIRDGTAVISGNFSPDEAKLMVRNLNLGALPVPIALASTATIGATLGDEALRAGLLAGIVGFIALAIFMIIWYRLPGIIAVVSLVIYTILMLAFFQLIPVVLTAAGMAAFILSVGLAVDANILIAERIKEELGAGKKTEDAIREGFARAWLAIRDSNIAHIIASIILFWLGTSIIKGFALVFGLGVLVSMFSAITISRTFLRALSIKAESGMGRFLMRSGLN